MTGVRGSQKCPPTVPPLLLGYRGNRWKWGVFAGGGAISDGEDAAVLPGDAQVAVVWRERGCERSAARGQMCPAWRETGVGSRRPESLVSRRPESFVWAPAHSSTINLPPLPRGRSRDSTSLTGASPADQISIPNGSSLPSSSRAAVE